MGLDRDASADMNQKLITDIIGYIAAVIGASMFFPQALQLWRTKKTKDISLLSFSLVLLSSILWIAYGFLVEAAPILLVNIIVGMLCVLIIYLKLRYK